MTLSRPALSSQGLAFTLPAGWEGAIYQRPALPGEHTFPVIHAATVALPPGRGDYGGGLVETLGPNDVFVAVLEFGPEEATSALFNQLHAVPILTPDAYRPFQLQRAIPGQAGVQRFFSTAGRPFCLYSVIGSFAARVASTAKANLVLGSLRIAAA